MTYRECDRCLELIGLTCESVRIEKPFSTHPNATVDVCLHVDRCKACEQTILTFPGAPGSTT